MEKKFSFLLKNYKKKDGTDCLYHLFMKKNIKIKKSIKKLNGSKICKHTRLRKYPVERYCISWLETGTLTAQKRGHLWLLPPRPDQVHDFFLRKTHLSTLLNTGSLQTDKSSTGNSTLL